MYEEQIDLHLSDADRISEGETGLQRDRMDMEGESIWYEVEDVLKTRTGSDGTYSCLVEWKECAEGAWTRERDASVGAVEAWDLKASREDVLKMGSQKQFGCSMPVGAMSETEGSMSASAEASRDPLGKEEIMAHPPGDVHYIDTEDEEKKGGTNVDRTRKRTRRPVQNDQLGSDGGSSSDSSTDSSSGSDSDREDEDTKRKGNTQCVVVKNAEVKVKIKSPVKKDIRGGKKSPNNKEETNRKEQVPIKRKASKSPDNNGDNVEKKGPNNKAKRVNEANNDVTSSVTGPAPRNLDRNQKSDEKEAMTNESNQNESKQDDKPRVKKQRERITAPERDESDREGPRHEEPTSSRRRYDSDSRSPSYRSQYRREHYPDFERRDRKQHRQRNEYPRRRTYRKNYIESRTIMRVDP